MLASLPLLGPCLTGWTRLPHPSSRPPSIMLIPSILLIPLPPPSAPSAAAVAAHVSGVDRQIPQLLVAMETPLQGGPGYIMSCCGRSPVAWMSGDYALEVQFPSVVGTSAVHLA